jgi:DNA-binding GntR family transcriptional regulator
MNKPKRINRVEQAYALLRCEVLENRLQPGFQATEAELALRLGMSRTPVREALLKLESEGLIEMIPRRGARVLPISPNDIREIYEVLTMLEPEVAANLAKAELDKEQLGQLEAAIQRMEQALDDDDLDAWAQADNEFHEVLLRLHDNERIFAFVQTLWGQVYRARKLTLRLRKTPTKSTAEHRQIVDRIAAGDAEGVRRAFREHRQRSGKELLGILEHYRLPCA